MIHRPMSDPGVFSQHQAMERESTGIVTPSGTFHQHVPAGYMDFPKVGVMVISISISIISKCLCYYEFYFTLKWMSICKMMLGLWLTIIGQNLDKI